MTLKSAKEFAQRLVNDDEWRAKIRDAKNKEERLALCKIEGYEFDENELKEAETDHEAELSSAQLDQVVGGGGWFDKNRCLVEGCNW